MAYCTIPAWSDDEKFMKAYHWMADQMRQRIGEPPIKDIKYPMWAWYQYNSAKSKKPPRSYLDIQEGISAYMEIDFPDSTGSSVISSYRKSSEHVLISKTDCRCKYTKRFLLWVYYSYFSLNNHSKRSDIEKKIIESKRFSCDFHILCLSLQSILTF